MACRDWVLAVPHPPHSGAPRQDRARRRPRRHSEPKRACLQYVDPAQSESTPQPLVLAALSRSAACSLRSTVYFGPTCSVGKSVLHFPTALDSFSHFRSVIPAGAKRKEAPPARPCGCAADRLLALVRRGNGNPAAPMLSGHSQRWAGAIGDDVARDGSPMASGGGSEGKLAPGLAGHPDEGLAFEGAIGQISYVKRLAINRRLR
jgi:hypothetical protein